MDPYVTLPRTLTEEQQSARSEVVLDATAPRSARCRRSWFAARVLAVLASTNPVTASDDGVAVGGAQVACVSEPAWFHTRTRDRTRSTSAKCWPRRSRDSSAR